METAKSGDTVSATLQTSASNNEEVKAKGVYKFEHWKPYEHLRAQYIELRDKVLAMKAKQAKWWYFFYKTFIEDLQEQIENIEFAMSKMIYKADEFGVNNVVATVGRNAMLDAALAGSAYTVTGPFIGLISNVSYTTGPAAGDTMASHGGWTEAGGTNAPTYTAPRKTAAWNAASGGSKALSANLSFAITSGTNVIIKGAFMVFGSGAVNTIDNTGGVLYSAGTFTGGDKTVSNGDTLTVSYSTALT